MTEITIDSKIFKALALAPVVTPRNSRPALRAVRFEPLPSGGVLAVATDGHAMAVVRDHSGLGSGSPVSVDFEVILAAAKRLKIKRNADPETVKLEVLDGAVTITLPDESTLKGPENTHDYPDWRAILPSPGNLGELPKGQYIRLAAPLLKAACAFIEAIFHGAPSAPVEILTATSETSPHVIVARRPGVSVNYIVMPIRSDTKPAELYESELGILKP